MIRVLLADDEPLVLIGLQGMLEWEKMGYTICGTARNGRQALETIQQEKPDIVVADVKMPLMDGLTLARTCREKGPLPVFIILTSFEQFDYVRQAMGAGAVDYLVKLELTPESLTAALARAAERVKKERALMGGRLPPPAWPKACAATRTVFLRGCTPGCFSRKRSWKRRCAGWEQILRRTGIFWSAVRSARRAQH